MPPRREGEGGGPLTLRKGRLGGRCRCSGSRGRGGAGEVAGGDAALHRGERGGCTRRAGRQRAPARELAGIGGAALQRHCTASCGVAGAQARRRGGAAKGRGRGRRCRYGAVPRRNSEQQWAFSTVSTRRRGAVGRGGGGGWRRVVRRVCEGCVVCARVWAGGANRWGHMKEYAECQDLRHSALFF